MKNVLHDSDSRKKNVLHDSDSRKKNVLHDSDSRKKNVLHDSDSREKWNQFFREKSIAEFRLRKSIWGDEIRRGILGADFFEWASKAGLKRALRAGWIKETQFFMENGVLRNVVLDMTESLPQRTWYKKILARVREKMNVIIKRKDQ